MNRFILFLTLFLPLSLHVRGSEPTVESLDSAIRAVNTLQGRFVQTKEVSLLGEDLVSRGIICFSKESSQLRWEYEEPYSHLIIIRPDTVLIKSVDSKEVTETKKSRLFKEIINLMEGNPLSFMTADSKYFKSESTLSGGEWIITAVPVQKDLKRMFSDMVLYVDFRRGVINKVTVKEQGGDTTTIEFFDTEINKPLPQRAFAEKRP